VIYNRTEGRNISKTLIFSITPMEPQLSSD
jgi:hypothetical protein